VSPALVIGILGIVFTTLTLVFFPFLRRVFGPILWPYTVYQKATPLLRELDQLYTCIAEAKSPGRIHRNDAVSKQLIEDLCTRLNTCEGLLGPYRNAPEFAPPWILPWTRARLGRAEGELEQINVILNRLPCYAQPFNQYQAASQPTAPKPLPHQPDNNSTTDRISCTGPGAGTSAQSTSDATQPGRSVQKPQPSYQPDHASKDAQMRPLGE